MILAINRVNKENSFKGENQKGQPGYLIIWFQKTFAHANPENHPVKPHTQNTPLH